MCLHYLRQLGISFPAYIYFQIYLYLLSFTIPVVTSRLMLLFGHLFSQWTGKLSIYWNSSWYGEDQSTKLISEERFESIKYNLFFIYISDLTLPHIRSHSLYKPYLY